MRHAVADDLRRRGGRVHDVGPQPEVGEQLERFGPPGEHGLGAEVDLDLPHRPDEELPAHPRRLLEHHDARRVGAPGQPPGRGQP